MEFVVSRHQHRDERYGIFVSLPQTLAVPHPRDYSLTVLAVAVFAYYGRHLAGGWRRTYAITAVVALYFNVFVLVVQLFEKVPG
jgi:hypothetical protein